ELRRDFGDWIDGYVAPKPDARYHRGMKAGELCLTRGVVDDSLAKGSHGLVDVRLRLKCRHCWSDMRHRVVLDRLQQQGGLVSEGSVERGLGDVHGPCDPVDVNSFIPMLPKH